MPEPLKLADGQATDAGTVTTTAQEPGLTEYVVLARVGEAWKVITPQEARNADGAIRAVFDAKPKTADGATDWVAVPERSWKPRKVRVVSEPRTVVE